MSSSKTHIAEHPYCSNSPCPTMETYVKMHDQRHNDLCAKLSSIATDIKEIPALVARQKFVITLLCALLIAIVGDWVSTKGKTSGLHIATAAPTTASNTP